MKDEFDSDAAEPVQASYGGNTPANDVFGDEKHHQVCLLLELEAWSNRMLMATSDPLQDTDVASGCSDHDYRDCYLRDSVAAFLAGRRWHCPGCYPHRLSWCFGSVYEFDSH